MAPRPHFDRSAPVRELSNVMDPANDLAWNFEKFLVGKNGDVIGRFKSGVDPDDADLKDAIEGALAG